MPFLIGLALKAGIPQRFAGLAVWGVIGLVLSIVLGVLYWRVTDGAYDRGVAHEHAKWVESAERWKAYTDRLDAQYRKKTTDMQASADKLRDEKEKADAENRAAIDAYARKLRRERNSRPAGAVPAAAIAPGTGRPGTCTAADLYAEDAEVALRFAGDTEAINNQLIECRALYNRARDTINEVQP